MFSLGFSSGQPGMVPPGGAGGWWQGLPPPQQQNGGAVPMPPMQPIQKPQVPLQQPPMVTGGAVNTAPSLLGTGLVQQRARVQQAGLSQHDSHSSSGVPVGANAAAGLWKTSNTGRALYELLKEVRKCFGYAPGGGSWGSNEAFGPVENLTKAFTGLSRLLQDVIDFCDTENMQKGLHDEFGQHMHTPQAHGYGAAGAASKFPVEAFVEQASDYARRTTTQMRALLHLLESVWEGSPTRISVSRDVQKFNTVVADCKEVYQLGSQVVSAAVGAVLPYLSTCSFFSKNGPHGAYRLWSLVGARIGSALRYIFQCVEVLRKTSTRMVDLVSGKIQTQSLMDFARSKPFFRAAAYLESAEARSASSVNYLGELLTAFQSHTASFTTFPQHTNDGSHHHHLSFTDEDDQQTLNDDDGQAEFSLMAEDIGDLPPQQEQGGIGAPSDDDYGREELQTSMDEPRFPWSSGPDAQEDLSNEMQTIEGGSE